MRPDVLFIVHPKDSAFTMSRIQSYMFFLFCRNNNDVIMHSWLLTHAWTTPCNRSTLFMNQIFSGQLLRMAQGSTLVGWANCALNNVLLVHVATPISTVLWDATGNCYPIYGGCRCGLPYFQIFYKERRIVAMDFCCGHWVTGSLAGWSHNHRQFRMVTDCDLDHSSKCGACWSDHTLINIKGSKLRKWVGGIP